MKVHRLREDSYSPRFPYGHFLSECEALDGERKALRSTKRDVASENFAIKVLNSIKDNSGQANGCYEEIARRFVSLAVIYNVHLIQCICDFSLSLPQNLLFNFILPVRLSVHVHLLLCSATLAAP